MKTEKQDQTKFLCEGDVDRELAVQLGWVHTPRVRCKGRIYNVPTWIRPDQSPDGLTVKFITQVGQLCPEWSESLDLMAKLEQSLFDGSADNAELEDEYMRQLDQHRPSVMSPYRMPANLKVKALVAAFRVTSFR